MVTDIITPDARLAAAILAFINHPQEIGDAGAWERQIMKETVGGRHCHIGHLYG